MGPIQRISFADVLKAKALLAQYAAECSIPEIGEVNPQAEMYAAMEQSEMTRTYGAFDGENLIGFASPILFTLPHYGRKVASMESIFVAPEFRHTGAGLKLLGVVEEEAKAAGCGALVCSAPVGSVFQRVLDRRKSYRNTSAVYVKKL